MTARASNVFEVDLSVEDESDLGAGGEYAALSSSDWTVETILSQMRRGNIQLNPRYQRRDAWTDKRKSKFIESLVLGLPIPQLVLAEMTDERGKYIVIDGKQRLLTMRRFASAVNDDDEEKFKPLALTGLEVLPKLNGKTYSDLSSDPKFAEQLAVFDNQTIRTVVVRQWPNEAYLYRIFHRLNTGSVQLSPQELRQALHPGPFLDFADTFSSESTELQQALRIDAPDFRMRDVEILIRFIAFSEFLPSYNGNLKAFLDRTTNELNRTWSRRQDEIREVAASCGTAIDATIKIFGVDNAFTRWNGEAYESRFNRAVFDIMTFYFRRPAVARAAVRRRRFVRARFERICVSDPKFRESIQTTTKTVDATFTRLKVWGDALARATGLKISRPKLVKNRIRTQ